MTQEKIKKFNDAIVEYSIIDIPQSMADELGIDKKDFMICKRKLLLDKFANEEIAVEQRQKESEMLKYKATLDYLKRNNLICKNKKNPMPSKSLTNESIKKVIDETQK